MAREAAAAPTLQEIVRLEAAAKPKIAAMLAYIKDHLFDPALSIGAIRKACNLRDNSVALQFHDALGLPPARLIASWRQAVAERMLANSTLPIWQISNLIGFSSIQVFSRSFFRIKGIRPQDYRRQMRGGSEPQPSPSRAPRQSDRLTDCWPARRMTTRPPESSPGCSRCTHRENSRLLARLAIVLRFRCRLMSTSPQAIQTK